jgi:antitoxin ParD1/3/4
MSTTKRVTVDLPAQLGRFADAAVDSGRYGSVKEVLCDALRQLMDRSDRSESPLDAARRKIDEGLKAAHAGDVADSHEFFTKLRRTTRKTRGSQRRAG